MSKHIYDVLLCFPIIQWNLKFLLINSCDKKISWGLSWTLGYVCFVLLS